MFSTSQSVRLLVLFQVLAAAAAAVNLAQRPALPLFDISRSYTSTLHEDQPVSINTAQFPSDPSIQLEGYVCKDDVEIGGVKARVPFACWTNTLNPELWSTLGNGIIGLGPGYPERQDSKGQSLPPPVLLSLSRDTEGSKGLPRKFALMASKSAAELQLGGFVAASVTGDIHYVQSRHPNLYSLGIKSIRIGNSYDTAQELLSFSPKAKQQIVPALVDTMQPCIMLPDSLERGNLIDSPYELYQNRAKPWTSMYVTVDGIDEGLEIAYEDLLVEHHTFLDEAWGTSIRPCIMPVSAASKSESAPVVLGSVFFRSYSVLFDLSRNTAKVPPTLGFGKIDPTYDIIGVSDWRATLQGIDKNPVHRIFVQHNSPKLRQKTSETPASEGEEVGMVSSNGHQFIIQLLVGTPAQPMHVVVDTASPVSGFFVDSASLSRFEHGERPREKGVASLAHRRPSPLAPTKPLTGGADKTRNDTKKEMASLVQILPFVGVFVLVLLLLFLKYR